MTIIIWINIFLGVGIDGPNEEGIILVKKKGKVQMLKDEIYAQEKNLQFEKVRLSCTNKI